MGRRKAHTAGEAKLLRSYVRDWKIDVEPETTLHNWDARHWHSRQIFEQILQIKDIEFDPYPSNGHSDQNAAAQKKLRVRTLQANAARCRREKDNEAGWINNVANLVFDSFSGFEFECQRCEQYLWLPDFIALPGDPIAAKRLLQEYRSRKVCSCNATEKASVVRVRTNSPSIFSNKSDERVIHNTTGVREITIDQKYKRPDRVYGLSITESFDRFADRLAKYSPFSAKHTLFPFMIVEAKSEKSDNGFHDIEQQTALSIRTCLKIHIDFEIESNQAFDPLVWFFGFRGDEWRLYVALPKNERTKIIDCWHGCISNADKALQLLLIVDMICFWARDVHRKSVIKGLSGLEARETTPAATVFSFHGQSAVANDDRRSQSLAFRPSLPPLSSTERDHQHGAGPPVVDLVEIDDEAMQETLEDAGLSHPNRPELTNMARSAHDKEHVWKYFAIPEDTAGIVECLRIMAPGDDTENGAKRLWETLTDKSTTVVITSKSISDVLQHTTENNETEVAAEEPLTIFLACQYRLRNWDWQVTCTYWCITCSQLAAHQLAMIAGITGAELFSINLWNAHQCDSLASAVADFLNLEGQASAVAAMSQDIYCIRNRPRGSSNGRLEWFRSDRNITQPRVAILEALTRNEDDERLNPFPQALLATSTGCTLSPFQLFTTSGLDEVPGVILKRPATWPETSPLWCYLSFEYGSQESVGQQIALAYWQKAIFAFGPLSPSDDQAISDWAAATKDMMLSDYVSEEANHS